jgi:hypothetical protein
MDIVILASRRMSAQLRQAAAAETIAKSLDLGSQVEAFKVARSKDADVDILVKNEALADLLEAIAAKLSPAPVSEPVQDGGEAVTEDAAAAEPAATSARKRKAGSK